MNALYCPLEVNDFFLNVLDKRQKKGITHLSGILAERKQKQDGVRSRQDCPSGKCSKMDS